MKYLELSLDLAQMVVSIITIVVVVRYWKEEKKEG
jgi:hypothetical protein